MNNTKITRYGSWLSPIKAELLASTSIGLGAISPSGDDTYWLETRPLEKGRQVIVRRSPEGMVTDMTPPEFNARTTVHEYGGGAYLVHGQTVYASNFADQRLYRLTPQLIPITPAPSIPCGLRYADGRVTPDGKWIICVRQSHRNELEADNELVAIPTDAATGAEGEAHIIASGYDFYSNPRISPDGRQLAWLCWNHPNMPWDGAELWIAGLTPGGTLTHPQRIAGSPIESIFQPEWSPEGVLHFVSDRTGWWNLYRYNSRPEPLTSMEAEFGQPQWVFGQSNYTFLLDGSIACVYSQGGMDHLAVISPQGEIQPVEIGFTSMWSLKYGMDRLWLVGASPTESATLVAVNLKDQRVEVIKKSSTLEVDPGYVSIPRHIEFPTENGLTAHAFYYPPANKDFAAPAEEKPPLLVISHGGPTGATDAVFSLDVQFWTSRGFGVVDVNYGGSTGYGRAYRERLNGQWGVVDIQDCINAARYLIAQGEADGKRVAVRGGSAGGYTTLVGLTMYDFFAAGASYFGLADLETWVKDTHKFESRYLDRLVGPYPEMKKRYRQRSPVNFAHQIKCPMILFQGLEDKVVPPSQAEVMVQALEEKKLPYAYLAFEGEQHGFRKAETIKRAAEAELYFYSRVFGFELPEPVEPVEIKNL
jgi:dipeptidyl aminopeptidase/acylaminoacyl peptidase